MPAAHAANRRNNSLSKRTPKGTATVQTTAMPMPCLPGHQTAPTAHPADAVWLGGGVGHCTDLVGCGRPHACEPQEAGWKLCNKFLTWMGSITISSSCIMVGYTKVAVRTTVERLTVSWHRRPAASPV